MSGGGLFAIDVASELRTLAEARFSGTWQIPAELVRFALSSGASEVEVRRRRRGFSVAWTGAAVEAGVLGELASALDGRGEPPLRQRAIAELERAGADALLSAGALRGARLRIDSGLGERVLRLAQRTGGRPRLRELPAAEPSSRQEIRWSCAALDARRAVAWLRSACRFAGARVSLDGSPLPRGFESGMYHVDITRPLPCRIGLTSQGEQPVLFLLREGIVAAKAAVPGYPPFEAAVELGGIVPGMASGADLRHTVQPYVAQLVEKAVWMMVQLQGRIENMEPAVRRRLQELLLRAASRGLRTAEVCELPLLETLGGDGSLLSVSAVAALAGRHGGRLYAIAPGDFERNVLADRSAVLLASAELRTLVAELTGVRLQAPPRRRTSRAGRWLENAAEWGRRLLTHLRGGHAGRPVADRDLIDSERRLLGLLREALAPRTVSLGAGGGEPRRTANGWVIPRRHPVLAAAARATAADEAWLYPLLLALKLDEPAPADARERWLRLSGGGKLRE